MYSSDHLYYLKNHYHCTLLNEVVIDVKTIVIDVQTIKINLIYHLKVKGIAYGKCQIKVVVYWLMHLS